MPPSFPSHLNRGQDIVPLGAYSFLLFGALGVYSFLKFLSPPEAIPCQRKAMLSPGSTKEVTKIISLCEKGKHVAV